MKHIVFKAKEDFCLFGVQAAVFEFQRWAKRRIFNREFEWTDHKSNVGARIAIKENGRIPAIIFAAKEGSQIKKGDTFLVIQNVGEEFDWLVDQISFWFSGFLKITQTDKKELLGLIDFFKNSANSPKRRRFPTQKWIAQNYFLKRNKDEAILDSGLGKVKLGEYYRTELLEGEYEGNLKEVFVNGLMKRVVNLDRIKEQIEK